MELEGRVAVVTGGAGGIGAALCRALLDEGMKVVVADVTAERVEAGVAGLEGRGEVLGVVTDVSSAESVEALADATWGRFGACHLLVNNAGVGAPVGQRLGDHTQRLALGARRERHGRGPRHPGLRAADDRVGRAGPRGQHLLGGRRHRAAARAPRSTRRARPRCPPSPSAWPSSCDPRARTLRASIFYPSGGLLRTGLWESDRTRPAELAREKPRPTEPMTVAKLEAMAETQGFALPWQDLDELARIVVDGLRDDDEFIHMIDRESMGPTLRRRADALEKGRLPEHEKGPLG